MTDERSSQRKKTKVEISAGGIVYKKQDGRVFILMIFPAVRQDAVKTTKFKPVWTFPKGWVGDHGDEKLIETAVREVKEEGGIDATVVKKLGQVKYFFQWEGQNVFKIVYWFLMEYQGGDPADHDEEVAESVWVPLEEVAAKLTYPTDKQTFKKALDIIESTLQS
jgi:8-oxo-dGTP pyrophosphatase MutT (NUDIX family)